MSRAASPFSARTLLAVLAIGAAAFLLLLYAIGAGWDGSRDNNGGAHAAGNGLTGFAGLVTLLEAQGHKVQLSRSEARLDDEGLLVLTPQLGTDGEDVAEIINEMNLALATVGKSFSPNALNEWEPKLRHSVWVKLMLGGNWMTDRTNVLTAAHDMAIIAAILAGPSAQVAKGYVHAAFRAAKDHSACPGGGSGAWCDFSI